MAGFAVWLIATLGLAVIGDVFIESGALIYALFVAVICSCFVALFAIIARWKRVGKSELLGAAAAFSIAGMVGEVPVMMTFPSMVPSLSATSADLFASFLFLGYAGLLSYALAIQTRR
ncbi:MAG: DUF5367 family protein [Pseudomonadota bacterium]